MPLPFLPGSSSLGGSPVRDARKPRAFDYKNGHAIMRSTPATAPAVTDEELEELASRTARMTYRSRQADEARRAADASAAAAGPASATGGPPPSFIAYDKKCLCFRAYFKQVVHESSLETFRVRYLRILFYPEDDTMEISEPAQPNSGLPQGRFLKRSMVPKDSSGATYDWKDLNIGENIEIYGKVLHIYDCDEWTRNFLEKEGIAVPDPEAAPEDPYLKTRTVVDKPDISRVTKSSFDKLQQFLVLDRKVLKFHAVLQEDGDDSPPRDCIIHFYLVSDEVEVREVHAPNDGRDPFPVILRRQRVHRNPNDVPPEFPSAVLEVSEHENGDMISPCDFAIGEEVWILGRKYLIYDMDGFTKEFYRRNFGVEDFEPLDVGLADAKPVEQTPPPHTGFGTPEDSLQSCVSLRPQPPKKDFLKLLAHGNSALRFSAIMETDDEIDKERKFVIVYALATDLTSIFEPPQRNSGIIGGKFLEATRIMKPGHDASNPAYYAPSDFKVGAKLRVLGRTFVLQESDEFTAKLQQEHPEMFE